MIGPVHVAVGALTGRRGGQARDASVEDARAATYPPPYPEGWYVVARSCDIGDRPVFVSAVGHRWVVFRGASGQVHAVEAYCPHLGANLADGKVKDDCVECPFHGWRIRGDGCVVGHSDGAAVDSRHRTTAWAVQELHGWVLVFHRHAVASGEPTPQPPYRPEQLGAIDDGELTFRGEHDAGQVQMHLLEFVENSVDFQHFAAIHGQLRLPWTEIPVPGMSIHHTATWRRDEDDKHVCWFGNEAFLQFRGRPIKKSGAYAEVRVEGPGSLIRFDFSLNRRGGRVVLYQSHTPVAPLTQHVRFRWFSDARVPKAMASFIVGNWVSQWRQDIGIWERKIYQKNPMLTRGDGPIHQLRRWYAQFYPSEAVSGHKVPVALRTAP